MRYRHDGFTAAKRRRFLKALGKTGCIADSARVAGISTTTVDRWRKKDARFERLCVTALDKAASHLDTLAWERGVIGIEEPVWHYGKLVGTRMKRSDAIFRMLLIASNRKKYGRMGAVARKEIEKEVRAEIARDAAAREPSIEEVRDEVLRRIAAIREHRSRTGELPPPEGAGDASG